MRSSRIGLVVSLVALILGGPITTKAYGEPTLDTVPVMPVVTARLRDGIDTTVGPCEDFDRFANGRWRARQARPTDALIDLKDRIDGQLVTMLEHARQQAATTTDPVLQLAGVWYASCLRVDSLRVRVRPTPGNNTAHTRELQCLALTEERMQPVLEYVFLRAMVTPTMAAAIPTWLGQVRSAVRAQVQALTWVPDSVRIAALQKLDTLQIRASLAPPSVVYRGVVLDSLDFQANEKILSAAKDRLAREAKAQAAVQPRTGREPPIPQWIPYRVGAWSYWGISVPVIEIAPALFQAPFFDLTSESAANFAALGMIIGHEMWHVLTPLFKWVDMPEARERVSRLVEQYSRGMGDGWRDGWRTVQEDLSDLGGLAAAYSAWTAHGRATAVATIEGFTPVQRFFLYYARAWRGTDRQSQQEKHSATYVRINGVVQQLPAFAKAFGCREGDAMFVSPTKQARVFELTP